MARSDPCFMRFNVANEPPHVREAPDGSYVLYVDALEMVTAYRETVRQAAALLAFCHERETAQQPEAPPADDFARDLRLLPLYRMLARDIAVWTARAAARIESDAARIVKAEAELAASRERERAKDTRIAELQRDAQRWNALVELWYASTELSLTQDEDGRWSITVVEPVEALPSPGRWTGDDPDAAIDALATPDSAQLQEDGK